MNGCNHNQKIQFLHQKVFTLIDSRSPSLEILARNDCGSFIKVIFVVAKILPPTLRRTHDSGEERGILDKLVGVPSIFVIETSDLWD